MFWQQTNVCCEDELYFTACKITALTILIEIVVTKSAIGDLHLRNDKFALLRIYVEWTPIWEHFGNFEYLYQRKTL